MEILNQKNEKIGEIDLPVKVFGIKWNPDLVHQALMVQSANSRIKVSHAKDRAEVRGGGKKPWRQKGTGRARHGSVRSPLWKGGGVTFGPNKNVNYKRKINKKMNRLAIFSVLSRKLKDQEIKIIDNFKTDSLKTKVLAETLRNIFSKNKNILIIPSVSNNKVNRIAKNIAHVGTLSPKSLNVHDLMKYKNIILEKEAVKEIADHFIKS